MQMRAPILLFLFWSAVPVHAQSWEAVRSLNAGDRIKVLETGGQEHAGIFVKSSAEAISLTVGRDAVSIERSRVRHVKVRSGSRRVRNLIIGAAVGLAVGVAVDQGLGTYLRNETGESAGTRAVSYIAPIAVFGGIAGAFPAYRTIYRTR